MNYSEIAFSDATKRFQERYGSRAAYARMEMGSFTDGLTASETEYIGEQDHFYMATIGENGFPYIQFRGGPKGFLKVINQKQLGFLDFRGNRQYVSIGNLTTNNKVSLILLDQAAKARLKIYAEAEILEIDQNRELYDLLNLKGYTYRAERIITLNIKAYDWNCPQHITARYTLEEIQEEFSAQNEFINILREENRALKAKLSGTK
jgi:predicted pyridoxine 5'-phosphate oxidase superfamily flavin-nucleotide-binding protein